MHILHTADIHFNQEWMEWLVKKQDNTDAIVIAGDLLNMRTACPIPIGKQIPEIRKHLRRFRIPVFVCSGNHDIWMAEPKTTKDTWSDGGWLNHDLPPNIITDGRTANLNGEKFAVVKYTHDNWPTGTTIVVAHLPPKNLKTAISQKGKNHGSQEIARNLLKKQPRLILSGHVHKPMKWHDSFKKTTSLNPGSANGPFPNHILIDTKTQTAHWIAAKSLSFQDGKPPDGD
jgi:Icc-related predicted phosphoesterase